MDRTGRVIKHRVQVGRQYIYYPVLLDRVDGRTGLVPGEVVVVDNLPSAPKANTMGHCYVFRPDTHQFIGLVHVNSLYPMSDKQLVIDALKAEVARKAEVL